MRLRRIATMSALAVGAVVVGGALGSGTGLAAAPETSAQVVAPAPAAAPTIPVPPTFPLLAPVVQAPRTEIVAHRGEANGALENTPAAVADAYYLGADAVEFDIVATSDGIPVAMHDAQLSTHTANCTGLTSQKTYSQIRKCQTKDGQFVPNLDEMLAQVPTGKRVYLHLKTPAGRGMAPRLLAAVDARDRNADERAVFFGSQPSVLEELRAAGATSLGLIFNDSAAGWAWTSRYQVLIPYQTPVTARLVRAAQARGKLVVPVQSHPTTMAQALLLGVDGFMANDLVGALNVLG